MLTEHCAFRCQPAYTTGGPQPAAAAFRELGQTVKKDHQPAGTDPSGESNSYRGHTDGNGDPERASSGAEEASCCCIPVSKSTQTEHMSAKWNENQFPKALRQSACQQDGMKTSFQKHTDKAHVSETEQKPVSKSTQTERMSVGLSRNCSKAHRVHVSGTK